MIGKTVREFLPADELLAYCTAIMRVYNRYGRRDNKYKARIKILVHELGPAPSSSARSRPSTPPATMPRASRSRPRSWSASSAYFAPPAYEALPDRDPLHDQRVFDGPRVRALGAPQHGAPQGAGLRHRQRLAEADRRHPRRRHLRADADRGGARRRVQPRRDPGHARAEPGPAARPEARPVRALEPARGCRARRPPTAT